ncbi:molybdate ABC transporter substrate-binding protein [Sorangium sp. So ce1024]|uniref:molybdate ABC transporter substrate-binding protein n=1 Tax=Sorangium sp. So ce1024 TaxID=3133327 RepID=UPI003F042F76
MWSLIVAVCMLAIWISFPSRPGEIHVAVASSFLGTLQELAPAFERDTGHRLVPSAGSSGHLYAQIQQGAPFDVFLSADADRPARLEAEGLAVHGSRFTYATGKLVLWSPRPGVVDDRGEILRRGDYRYIALANPRTAPYGAAAREVLTALGLWERLSAERKLSVGESLGQAFLAAASGGVDMAFVALSQVRGADGRISGSFWVPPEATYPRLDHDAVILARSDKQDAAARFTSWLRTAPAATDILLSAGYSVDRR